VDATDNTVGVGEYWGVGHRNGFLPAAAAAVPESSPFSAADELLRALPALGDEELADRVSRLAPADPGIVAKLDAPQLEGSLRAYSFLAHRLIHSGVVYEDRAIPAGVAQPFWILSRALSRPPGLSYAGYILSNFDGAVPRRQPPEEIAVPRTFTGTPDEAWLIAVALAVESAGGDVVRGVEQCSIALDGADPVGLEQGLERIADALEWATSMLPQLAERVDPAVFAESVGPLLLGFDDVRFLGVPGSPTVSYGGETGAQSGALQAADLSLGIRHDQGTTESLDLHAAFAPRPHRAFMGWARSVGAALNAHVARDTASRDSYRLAAGALARAREAQLGLVEGHLTWDARIGGRDDWLRRLAADARQAAVA
jgi:indoleamine 2,3-dioxygenase